jgi:site-specific DNA-methyltransferase (adenine-specific)
MMMQASFIGFDQGSTAVDFSVVKIGPHTLYQGDAYGLSPSLGFFDAEVTDPPYKFRAEGGGHYRSSRATMDQIVEEKLSDGFDLAIINPLLCGATVVFCHNDQLPSVLPHIERRFERFALCVWRKANPQPVANKHYRPVMEFYIHAWNRRFHPQGTLKQLDRQIICYSPRGKQKFGHPTVKPDPVMEKILRNVAGRTVIDPFMGTGSTGVAAIGAGRVFTGIEKNPKHFATAVARITAAYEAAPVQHSAESEKAHG